MPFTIRATNMKAFRASLDGYLSELEKPDFLLDVVRSIMQDVIRRTPVLTGRAKASWLKAARALNLPYNNMGYDDRRKAQGLREGSFKIIKKKHMIKIVITSNVPYILKLEHGYSKKAPGGMLLISIKETLDTAIYALWTKYNKGI